MTKPATVHHIRPLTSLRFFAATIVLFSHTCDFFPVDRSWFERARLNRIDLSFFFLLSGFILFYVYPSLPTPKHTARFIFARLARIWPLHFLMALVVLLTGLAAFDLRALANLALVSSWIPTTRFAISLNWPTWSISVELLFYLTFPFWVRNWQKTGRAKLAFVTVFMLCYFAIINYYANRGMPLDGALDQISIYNLITFHPFGRIFEFVLGMATFAFWKRTREPLNRTLKNSTALYTALELTAIAIVTIGLYFTSAEVDFMRELLGTSGAQWTIRSGMCIPLSFLVYILAFEKGLVSRLLSIAPLVLLGDLSYTIYLLHQVPLRLLQKHSPNLLEHPAPLTIPLFWLSVFLISYALWRFFEHPMRAKMLAWWDRRS